MTRESWLAGSNWSLRSMFGTAASLAGIQNRRERLDQELRHEQPDRGCRRSGSRRTAPNRMTSTTTIVLRRSNRSAKAPASGPSTIAGSRRKSSTPPSAKLAAANPLTSDVAVAVIASRPEPVAEARQRHRQPQPAEVADPQDRAQLGHQPDRTQRAVGRTVRRAGHVVHGASTGDAVRSAGCASPRRRAAAPVASGRTESGLPGVGGGEARPSAASRYRADRRLRQFSHPAREPGFRPFGRRLGCCG